jgi:hypothetical protein
MIHLARTFRVQPSYIIYILNTGVLPVSPKLVIAFIRDHYNMNT